MGVLRKAGDEMGLVADKLTTKFVYDWRLKDYKGKDGLETKRWLRPSHLVAREYAFLERRSDTYSPATSTHILNLLPLVYLQKLGEKDVESAAESAGVASQLRCEGRNSHGAPRQACQDSSWQGRVPGGTQFARAKNGCQELVQYPETPHGGGFEMPVLR